MTSLFKNKRTTFERAEKYISKIYWTDINLYGQLYKERLKISDIQHFAPPTVKPFHAAYQRPSFQEVISKAVFSKTETGKSFGPTWTTHWFRLQIEIPESWIGKEVHLLWNSGSEALVWTQTGIPLQGLSEKNNEEFKQGFILSKNVKDEERSSIYYIEMACNTLFGAGKDSMIAPADPDRYFTLQTADIVVFDRQVYNLIMDLHCLIGMVQSLPENNPRSFEALYTANKMINSIIPGDRNTYSVAAGIGQAFFNQKNGASQHTVCAIGNCHIDSAWLWPYSESVRKCARSWASTVLLMEEFPDYVFACSQAQQLHWVKEYYPPLFDKLKLFAKRNQFIPVGGTWVEMDGNLPSGESFIRQFLYGQHFFQHNFGHRCSEFWLPDTFGYSAQIPQIMKHCGTKYFLTQKLSWNLVNTFPHNNFLWEGIDGSTIITHFPPGNSYEFPVHAENVIATVKNLKDKGRVSQSILLYGHGDGGGGPTEDMIQRIKRFQDVDGFPKVKFSTPSNFFSQLESESSNLCRWVGELYLELHNGTYTTHAETKLQNRRGEFTFHNVELLMSVLYAYTKDKADYPEMELRSQWYKFLLNQFHDVLPGTSIHEVYDQSSQYYTEVNGYLNQLLLTTQAKLFGPADSELQELLLVNTLGWPRKEILSTAENHLQAVVAEPFGVTVLQPADFIPVKLAQMNGNFILKNAYIEAIVDNIGRIVSLKHLASGKESISPGKFGNQLVLFDDVPLYWDAWDVMDYHLETRKEQSHVLDPVKVKLESPLRCVLQVSISLGDKSKIHLEISLDAVKPYVLFSASVDWKETHKFLKVEFPVNVVAKEATYEIQFGHLTRPTHYNTSWDWAKFEVCGHKWADIAEFDFGVAVLNDSKYGYSAHGNKLTLSLLRSPKSPDAEADMGHHKFRYALMPHSGTFQSAGVIQQAYELNCPLLLVQRDKHQPGYQKEIKDSLSWFKLDNDAVVLETVKKAENKDNALVLRLYESYGSHTTVNLRSSLNVQNIHLSNGLEDEIQSSLTWDDGILLEFRPFQIISLLIVLK